MSPVRLYRGIVLPRSFKSMSVAVLRAAAPPAKAAAVALATSSACTAADGTLTAPGPLGALAGVLTGEDESEDTVLCVPRGRLRLAAGGAARRAQSQARSDRHRPADDVHARPTLPRHALSPLPFRQNNGPARDRRWRLMITYVLGKRPSSLPCSLRWLVTSVMQQTGRRRPSP